MKVWKLLMVSLPCGSSNIVGYIANIGNGPFQTFFVHGGHDIVCQRVIYQMSGG